MNLNLVTTSTHNEQGRPQLTILGNPFRKDSAT